MPIETARAEPVPTGMEVIPRRRFLALLTLGSLGVTAVISRGIWRSYRGPDLAADRLAERRRYYRTVLLKADLTYLPAEFWEEVPR